MMSFRGANTTLFALTQGCWLKSCFSGFFSLPPSFPKLWLKQRCMRQYIYKYVTALFELCEFFFFFFCHCWISSVKYMCVLPPLCGSEWMQTICGQIDRRSLESQIFSQSCSYFMWICSLHILSSQPLLKKMSTEEGSKSGTY